MDTSQCVICCERMEMCVYERPSSNPVVYSDKSSTRLTCGHAFHSSCLVLSLHSSQKCPLCNVADTLQHNPELDYRRRMYVETCCKNIVEEIKSSEIIEEHLKDYKAFRDELEEKRKVFNARVKEYKQKLREEMYIERSTRDVTKIQTSARNAFKKEIKKRGGIFGVAFSKMKGYVIDELLFGKDFRNAWYFSMKNRRDFW